MLTSADGAPRRGSGRRRRAVVTAVVAVLLLGGGGVTGAAPPPDDPGDTELRESRRTAQQRAEEVGRLANELARVRSELADLRSEVALRLEETNRARVDLAAAEAEATAAAREATAAEARTRRAATAVTESRAEFDRFVAAAFRQGGTVDSVSAHLGARDPGALLERRHLLRAAGGVHRDTMRRVHRAHVARANADAEARAAADRARRRRDEAEAARAAAERAQAEAVAARRELGAQAAELEDRHRAVEQRLERARQRVRGLEDQRDRYQRWRDREAAAAAAQTSPGTRPQGSTTDGPGTPEDTAGGADAALVERVVSRATSQLGVPYAWGGGNTTGPTRGIRDGGVADRHGDYRKTGFDCSGLMIYAFAGVTTLPHYSGYQYHAGRKVPLSEMRRGDMLFWGPDRIHHVALYLGGGRMIEAPYSGGHVRVAPVRYDGIMPFATRLVG